MPFRGTPWYAQSPEKVEEHRKKIRQRMTGEGNPNWKGKVIKSDSGRARARRNYTVRHPCEFCGNPKVERHHRDDDPWNNTPPNIQWLCRRHHMIIDGRMATLLEMNHNRHK